MFQVCTGLTAIPDNLLPATTLVADCYSNMFYGCTGLTAIPENLLPATTLANYCYYYMFYGCTGLTSLPADLLPATTLTQSCYQYMFYQCSQLTDIGTIDTAWFAARTPAQSSMFRYDTAITTPITYANIPDGWK
jgi:hypothetical protein